MKKSCNILKIVVAMSQRFFYGVPVIKTTNPNTMTTMTTTDKDQFIRSKKFKILLNSKGEIIGERIKGIIHVYLGTKRPCHN